MMIKYRVRHVREIPDGKEYFIPEKMETWWFLWMFPISDGWIQLGWSRYCFNPPKPCDTLQEVFRQIYLDYQPTIESCIVYEERKGDLAPKEEAT